MTSTRCFATSIVTESTLQGDTIPGKFWYSSVSLIGFPSIEGFFGVDDERNHGIPFAPRKSRKNIMMSLFQFSEG